MTPNSTDLDPFAPWQGISYRFTIFFKDPETVPHGDEAFLDFFGVTHAEKVEKPAELLEFYTAPDDGVIQQVSRSPKKLDFLVQASARLEIEGAKVKGFTHSYCNDNLPTFRASTERILRKYCENITRLAVGADLGAQVPNREVGYEAIGAKLLTLKPDPKISSELSYQINYPRIREFGGKTLRINRLSTWSCVGTVVEFDDPEGNKVVTTIYHAKVRLDINSEQSFDVSELASEHQVELVNTLFDFALEIGNVGETP